MVSKLFVLIHLFIILVMGLDIWFGILVKLTIPGVYRTGYAVLAATAVIGSYLAFLW